MSKKGGLAKSDKKKAAGAENLKKARAAKAATRLDIAKNAESGFPRTQDTREQQQSTNIALNHARGKKNPLNTPWMLGGGR